jgi:hypothetical protein
VVSIFSQRLHDLGRDSTAPAPRLCEALPEVQLDLQNFPKTRHICGKGIRTLFSSVSKVMQRVYDHGSDSEPLKCSR